MSSLRHRTDTTQTPHLLRYHLLGVWCWLYPVGYPKVDLADKTSRGTTSRSFSLLPMPLLPSLLRSCTPPRATCGKPSPPRGPQKVAILDCGAQYGKVIDRRIRELAVECDLLPLSTPAGELREAYAAIVISGGPQSVYDADAPKYDPAIFELGMPVLGICYGMQLMACAAGGQVEPKAKREDGQFEVCIERGCALFAGVKGGSTEVSERVSE